MIGLLSGLVLLILVGGLVHWLLVQVHRDPPHPPCLLLALGLSVTLAVPATAAPITFQFTGVINSQPISGSYTFDSTTPFNNYGNQGHGRVSMDAVGNSYQWGLTEILTGVHHWDTAAQSITAATINWNNQQGTINLVPQLSYDPMYLSSSITAHGDLYGATVQVQGLTGYDHFGLTLENLGPYHLLTSLPTVPPSLNGSPAPLARIELFQAGTFNVVQGELLTLTAVPIPGALLLFGSGLLALYGWTRRQTR